mgnify:CR=1 FL=1
MHEHSPGEPHEHPTNLANAPHYHFEGDEDAERFGWAHVGPEAELCTSVHYPPIDGKPDSRDGWALFRESAGLLGRYRWHVDCDINRCPACQFLARREVRQALEEAK